MVIRYLKARLPQWLPTEFRVLAIWGIVIACLLAFAQITDAAFADDNHAFDHNILLWLRQADDLQTPRGALWIKSVLLNFTALGSAPVLIFLTLATVIYLVIARKHFTAVFLAAAIVSGTILNAVLKHLFQRARPDVVPYLTEFSNFSFPSGHTIMSAIVYLTIGILLARTNTRRAMKIYIMALAIGLTLIVGISRIYLGVHWPTDVLAGWCLGIAWAILWSLLATGLQRRMMENKAKNNLPTA